MKKSQIVFAVIALLIACSPEEKNLAPSVTVGVKDLSDNSVVLIGKANLGSTVASDLKVGFQYSESAGILPSNSKTVEAFNADANYNYSAEVSGLEPGTTYYFRSFVRQNGVDTFGETKSFTTTKTFVTQIKLDKTNLTLHEGESDFLSITIVPNNASDRGVTLTSSNESVASVDEYGVVTAKKKGQATIKVSANDGSGVSASCAVSVKNPLPQGAVDLGLVMTREDGTTYDLYWAESNLYQYGLCPNPEDYGDYYAWGETETKAFYQYETYKWCDGSFDSLTKYNTDSSYGNIDNKTVLEEADDIAHVKIGGNWRMPTAAEWIALVNSCSSEMVTQNGVYGCKITGPNGNSIFLPAAGYMLSNTVQESGNSGYYWSSSVRVEKACNARGFFFAPDLFTTGHSSRCCGFSVRPVTE